MKILTRGATGHQIGLREERREDDASMPPWARAPSPISRRAFPSITAISCSAGAFLTALMHSSFIRRKSSGWDDPVHLLTQKRQR
jgi:hypothetical protein